MDDIITDHETTNVVEIAPATEPAAPAHVMLDLETWGSSNDALIISIGACKFDANDILDRFHVAIEPSTAQQLGAKIDADTILWWLHPDRDEARVNWLKQERVPLPSALIGFNEWCGAEPQAVGVWGNGATFDNVILRSSYRMCGFEYPVRFWQDQCYRTMKNRTPRIELVREGVHHNALDDAVSQAKHLQAILRETGATL